MDRANVNGFFEWTRMWCTKVQTWRYVRNVSSGQWTSTLLSKNEYSYNQQTGQKTANLITDQYGNTRTESYNYDELSRLSGVSYGDGQTQGYSFDSMGNRLAKTDNQTGSEIYGYNNANMLLTRNGQSYNNDANGNTLSGGGRTMTWDSQNRMASCVYGTGANQKTSSFAYGTDGLRRRMSVTSSTGSYTTDYVLEGNNVVQELTTTASNVNPILTATYLTGPSGPMYKRPANAVDVRWYVYDGGGNVTGEIDALGNLTASEKHDVYGASRGVTGTATSKHGWQGQVGHQSDGETGLVYMRARYYAPELGRFQSEDPAKDGINWFGYCNNNPVNFGDFTGKAANPLLALFKALFSGMDEAAAHDIQGAAGMMFILSLISWGLHSMGYKFAGDLVELVTALIGVATLVSYCEKLPTGALLGKKVGAYAVLALTIMRLWCEWGEVAADFRKSGWSRVE
jgi:RHS repeat-associated protein